MRKETLLPSRSDFWRYNERIMEDGFSNSSVVDDLHRSDAKPMMPVAPVAVSVNCRLTAERRKPPPRESYPIGAPPVDVQQLDVVRGGNGPWPTWRRCVKACGRVCPRSKKFEM